MLFENSSSIVKCCLRTVVVFGLDIDCFLSRCHICNFFYSYFHFYTVPFSKQLYEVGGHLFEVCHHDNFMSRVIVLSVFQSTCMITSTELLAGLQRKQRNNLACLFCIVDLSVLLNRCVI